MILIFFIIFILFLLILLVDYYNKRLNIIFLNINSLSKLLQKDFDNFYLNLSTENLKLRNIQDKDKFLKNIKSNLYNINYKEKIIIKNAIYKAHKKLNKINYPGFNGNKIKKYPWIIGCSYNNNYEFGYPHTRGSIIILNKDNIYDKDLYKTLIHERIHVYQKLFPNDINKFLKYYNFSKFLKKTNLDRANPDTDNYIYKYNNNILFECKINNFNQINCTYNSNIYEHPFEYMAYDIVNNLK